MMNLLMFMLTLGVCLFPAALVAAVFGDKK